MLVKVPVDKLGGLKRDLRKVIPKSDSFYTSSTRRKVCYLYGA